MSCISGPNNNTNGLVFEYDMANTQKSWKGAPTTNKIITDPIALGIYAYVSGPVATTNVADSSGNLRTVNRYTITATTNARRAAIRPSGLTTGVTYSFSYMYKNNGTGTDVYVDASKGNPEGGANNNTLATSNVTTQNLGNGWVYVKYTFSYSACPTSACILGYGNSNGLVGETFDVYNEQFEINAFATPYVNGTRSNTQALLDLTGNSTLTASSLTYANDGTFSFNGNSNTIDCGNSAVLSTIGGTSTVTIEAWVNYYSYTGGAQAYSVITHKGYPWSWLMENISNVPRIRFYLSGSGDVACPDTTSHNLNTWYHFVGSYDGTNMKFYRNGELRNTVAGSGTLGGAGSNMVIGSYSNGYFMNGVISSVKVYNRTLSASEIASNYNSQKEKFFGYQAITYISSSNVTLTNNGTTAVTMFKTASNNSWDSHVYSADAFNAPCTIEFTKNAGTTDNGVSYAMIGWNADPTTDQSYSSLDYAAYPYRTDTYSVYHNGSQVLASGTWDPNQKFYIVYDTDGYIRHYNGSKLLYSVNKGTNQTVYVDSSFYSVNATYGGFTDVRVCRKSWNGLNYVG